MCRSDTDADGGAIERVSERASGGDTANRTVVHGIDFSGARNAGEKTWVASAVIENGLRIERCYAVADEIGTADRGPTFEYLRDFIAGEHRAVVGCDFSFGMPRAVTSAGTWGEFLGGFSFESRDAMVDTYVSRTRERTNGERTYLKRATDTETGASSPYGFIVSSQTLYGIRDVLRPLVRNDRVSVLPMDTPDACDGYNDRTWLCEIYPAATLRDLGLPSEKYKNDRKYPEARARRERIVSGLCKTGLTVGSEAITERVIGDSGGDALDSVVAAFAVFRALSDGRLTTANDSLGERSVLEGHIYV